MSDKQSFLKQFDHIAAAFPVQGDARAAIHNGLDFPTSRDEYWKYTRTKSIIDSKYCQSNTSVERIDSFLVDGLDAHLIVFVNGLYAPAHSSSSFEEGLEVTSIASTSGNRKDQMLQHLGQHIDSKHHAFTAFNTSYFKDGVYITVADDAVISKPVVVLNIMKGEKEAANSRNLIHIGKNAQVQIVSQHEGDANEGSFCNAVTELVADDGAHASLYVIQNDGNESTQVNSTQVVQARNSNVSVVTVTKSGKLVRNNLNFTIKDEGCESNMYGIYFTSGKQHVDNHTYADHMKSNCNSNELYKGVMTDRSTGVFNGKIMVHQEAQKTNAFQSNQNILLSDSATINTKPELEIYADDVKCSHGCTIGQLDEEALFYLRSRGLGEEAATKLLIQAFAGDVLEEVKIDALKASLEAFIQQKFAVIDA